MTTTFQWTDPTLIPRSTKVKTVHINELRDAAQVSLQELEDHTQDRDAHLLATEIEPGFMAPEDKTKILGHTHSQITPSDTWVIEHNMNAFPSVTITDSAGSVVQGDVTYDTHHQVTVSFNAPFSGTAHLNA